jgi:hypothetical protein
LQVGAAAVERVAVKVLHPYPWRGINNDAVEVDGPAGFSARAPNIAPSAAILQDIPLVLTEKWQI